MFPVKETILILKETRITSWTEEEQGLVSVPIPLFPPPAPVPVPPETLELTGAVYLLRLAADLGRSLEALLYL